MDLFHRKIKKTKLMSLQKTLPFYIEKNYTRHIMIKAILLKD
jgi:hypothetical protein